MLTHSEFFYAVRLERVKSCVMPFLVECWEFTNQIAGASLQVTYPSFQTWDVARLAETKQVSSPNAITDAENCKGVSLSNNMTGVLAWRSFPVRHKISVSFLYEYFVCTWYLPAEIFTSSCQHRSQLSVHKNVYFLDLNTCGQSNRNFNFVHARVVTARAPKMWKTREL